MKQLFILFFIFVYDLEAQITYNPIYSTNVKELTIKKISIENSYTLVDFELYTTRDDFTFFFPSKMFIRAYMDITAPLYYVKEFVGNELDRSYTPKPNTTYQLQLKFGKIAEGIEIISINEPNIPGHIAWEWTKIAINNPKPIASQEENFFKYVGVKTLATLAHPTNTFISGEYSISPGYVVVKINYEGGIFTKLRIDKRNGIYSKLTILEDSDFFSPFLAITLIKSIVDNEMKNSDSANETKSLLERELGKLYYQFNGEDVSLFLLNMYRFNY